MCCLLNEKYTNEFIARAKKAGKKFIYGWKVLTYDGKALNEEYQYNYGIHSEDIEVYDKSNPQGFHFYISLKGAKKMCCSPDYRIVKVKMKVDDILGLEDRGFGTIREGVARSIHITRDEWRKAFKRQKD